MRPFFITIPHSGEIVPPEATWLQGLPEKVVMCDVDRYVDQLYLPTLQTLNITHVIADFHRYVVDLNRLAEDVDASSVEGHKNPPGTIATGLIWVKTTTGIPLLPRPISQRLYQQLVEQYFLPFHNKIEGIYARFQAAGAQRIFHLDAHSMPSMGTDFHRDPGQRRAEIVVSDMEGKSCAGDFKDLVIASYREAGFDVAYNWPYVGGRLTQTYGRPKVGHHSIQVELRRDLYMNEESKRLEPQLAAALKPRLGQAVKAIVEGLESL